MPGVERGPGAAPRKGWAGVPAGGVLPLPQGLWLIGRTRCRGAGPRLGPHQCCPQHQIVQYLRDMFDLDNVRYTSVPALADDILQLSRRRSEILLGYLGAPAASSVGLNGVLPRKNGPQDELQ